MSDGAAAVTETRLLGGRLIVRQPARGHRAGTDAVLVATAAALAAGERIVDVGSGVGTIGLALALREPAAMVRLLEREPILAALARENVALNGLAGRAAVEEADLFGPAPSPGEATLVVSNPPFYAEGTIRASQEPLKRRAHALEGAGHGDWLRAILRLLAPHGRLVLLHRPEALPALLAAGEGRIGAIRIRPIHAHAGGDAIRILLGGTVGTRAPLTIDAPLVLQTATGAFSPIAAALHDGTALLPLLDTPTRKSRPQGPALHGKAAG